MIVQCKSCHSLFKFDSSLIKPNGSWARCSKCQKVFRVYQSNMADRRKHQRVKTQNLISHFSVGETDKFVSEGFGKALNISRGGMLLETPYPIESDQLSLLAVDLEDNVFEINGRLIYSKKSSARMYLSGIAFVGSDEKVATFLAKLVKEYNYQRNNIFIRWYNQKPLPISQIAT